MHLVYFFFQAEDGIRDDLVTGVQTCALPISHLRQRPGSGNRRSPDARPRVGGRGCGLPHRATPRCLRRSRRREGHRGCRTRRGRPLHPGDGAARQRAARASRRAGRRHRGGGRATAWDPDELRRAVPRDPRVPHRARPSDARPRGRRDSRRARHARLREHAADPRAAHPAREGHEQHLHERGDRRNHRRGVSRAHGTGRPERGRASRGRQGARARAPSRRSARMRGLDRWRFFRPVRSSCPEAGAGARGKRLRAPQCTPCGQRPRRGDRRALRRSRRSDHSMHRDDDRRRDGRARRGDRERRRRRSRDGDGPVTIRTQVIPESGVKTAVPALEPLLIEIHEEGRAGRHVRGGEDADALIPAAFRRRAPLGLPELSEPQVVRHFTHLAQLNYAVDTGMYPLGSCTMKYNPKINDRVASLFADLHPKQPQSTVQGALTLLAELEGMLAKLTGMDAVTLQPAAGANMNALLGVARPGDLGFDCIHINVHKTFSTPHGAGGPGAGPLCVKELLRAFLPKPWIVRDEQGRYHLDIARDDQPPAGLGDSIGRVRTFLGNFGVLVRAYTYMRTLGEEGLAEASNDAILAANYLLAQLREHFDVAFDRACMHEFVLSASRQKKQGASALDIAKALIDEGFHPPTVYFPLVVPEALMIEPTETEPRETLDAFAAAIIRIAERAKTDSASVKAAPKHAPLARLDEVTAARNPKLKWQRPT